MSQTVQVEANAAQVETENTSVGTVIENQRILDLPLNGRQATDLIQLTGAAIPAGVNGTAGFPGGQNIADRRRSAFRSRLFSGRNASITIRSTPPIFRSRSRTLWKNSKSRPAL